LFIDGNALRECLVRKCVVLGSVTAFLCAFSFIIHIPIVLNAIIRRVCIVSHSISVFLFLSAVLLPACLEVQRELESGIESHGIRRDFTNFVAYFTPEELHLAARVEARERFRVNEVKGD
jgi:hypothetical protein